MRYIKCIKRRIKVSLKYEPITTIALAISFLMITGSFLLRSVYNINTFYIFVFGIVIITIAIISNPNYKEKIDNQMENET